jgi:hypothetical protein
LPAQKPSILRTVLRLAGLAVFILLINLLLNWIMQQIGLQKTTGGEVPGKNMMSGLIVLIFVVYTLLMAIPFVPGIEISIGLLMVQGPGIAPYVFVATVLALLLAYLAGRYVPYSYLHRVFADVGLRRACALVDVLQPLDTRQRLALLRSHLPARIAPLVLNNRYVLLAVALNIPGNSIIGGGGGICMIAGLSRLFTLPVMLITLLIAVAPVPVLVYFFGVNIWE